MRMTDILEKKKRGEKLSREEIKFFIDGYTKGEIPDYQASAFTMAVIFQGLDKEETANIVATIDYHYIPEQNQFL